MTELRSWAAKADLGLLFLLSFLVWLLNHPYQGLWHDARIYGLLAAQWQNPEAYAKDLFFSFGSQGSFSLFTPVYGALVASLGLDRAAWWVTLSGGILWITACLALARTMLGSGFGVWFAVLLGAVVSVSYSPNNSTFILGENFATARSWAIPVGMIGVAAVASKKRWLGLTLSLVATALHPLQGGWSFALWVLIRVRASTALILSFLPVAVLVLLGLLNLDFPHIRLMSGEWLEFSTKFASDIVFRLPQQSRLLFYSGVLVAIWLGTRWGNESWRVLYLRSLMLGAGGLGVALVVSYVFPIEIAVQVQAWRVMALLIPLAALAVIDIGQRVWHWSACGQLLVGLSAVLASTGYVNLVGLIWVLGIASFVSKKWIDQIKARIDQHLRSMVVVLLVFALSVLPSILATWEISGSQWLNPWWDDESLLQGLVSGGNWHLAALLALLIPWWVNGNSDGTDRKWARIIVLFLVSIVTAVTLFHWDRRPEKTRIEQACYLDQRCRPHPFSDWIMPGSVVFWPERELTVWFELRTASYFGTIQGIGRVFSSAKYYEWQRRQAWAEGQTDPRNICNDSVIDWVVRSHPVPGLLPRMTVHYGYLFACSDLRAIRPEPATRPAR